MTTIHARVNSGFIPKLQSDTVLDLRRTLRDLHDSGTGTLLTEPGRLGFEKRAACTPGADRVINDRQVFMQRCADDPAFSQSETASMFRANNILFNNDVDLLMEGRKELVEHVKKLSDYDLLLLYTSARYYDNESEEIASLPMKARWYFTFSPFHGVSSSFSEFVTELRTLSLR